jgi:hypothetical protein
MVHLNPWLIYFAGAACATGSGLVYWMAIENLVKVKSKFVLVFILSLFLTPLGAWIISLIFKARQAIKELKQLNESAA